ncbi:MAG TPA: hypothetical protein V6D06_08230 [Trichocoleus sp.]
MEGFRKEIDTYTEIRQYLSSLTNTLKDMNALPAKIHTQTGFSALIEAVNQKLAS